MVSTLLTTANPLEGDRVNFFPDLDFSIVEIKDRYVILNWSLQTEVNYNSFQIDLYSDKTNQTTIWSFISLNHFSANFEEDFSIVNYTLSSEIFRAEKISTSNFTVYSVPYNAESVQVKVTGLIPEESYLLKISISNITFVEGMVPSVIVSSSSIIWSSFLFQTLSSIQQASVHSRTATVVSLLIIILVFLILFAFIAKKDIPFNKIAYIFIFPALFALALLEVYPILYGFVLSFTSYSLERGETPIFNAFENYAYISQNPHLSITLTTTLVWSTVIIFFKLLSGFLIAYFIQYKVKRKKLWYLSIYIPWAIPAYIKILSWRSFFHGNAGYSLFNLLFGTSVNFVSQPYVTFFIASFVEVIDSIPLITTLFLGAMSSIPKELMDIAEVDQINERSRIRHIVLPLIKPVMLPVLILEIIKAFGSFNVSFLLTRGYPLLPYGTNEAGVVGATDLFSTFTFYMFYQRREVGISAAYSTIMSLLTLFFVLIWIKMSKGTQSTFRPTKIKQKKKNQFIIAFVLFSQSIGYFLATTFNFRYFGIYWNKTISYTIAASLLICAILIVSKKDRSWKIFSIIIALDLILSLSQFFFYQMWFAFNWNIFISGVIFYVIKNNNVLNDTKIGSKSISKIKVGIIKVKRQILSSLNRLDEKFVEINRFHSFLGLEIFVVLLSCLLDSASDWILWLILSILVINLIVSLFITQIKTFSFVLQVGLWITLLILPYSLGWKIIELSISVMLILYLLKHFITEKRFVNRSVNYLNRSVLKVSFTHFLMIGIIIVSIIPLWNVVWIAFSSGNKIVPDSFFPSNPTFENFKLLFTEEKIYLNFGNSLIISLGSAILCVVLTILAAYAFSRYDFKLKSEIMVGVFILKMFTGVLTLIPLYLIMFNLGLIDTYLGVIIAYSTHTIPIALWLLKGYFDSIPKELDESSQLIGNSSFFTLRKVILPLAGPAIAVVFLLNFIATWNGFLLAFVLLQSTFKYTLPIKLYSFIGSIESSTPLWGLFAAASVLVIIPLLILFIFLRNYLLKGLGSQAQIREV